MSEEQKPVQTVPDAGAEQAPAEVVTPEVTETEPSVLNEALAIVEQSDKALAAAETKIVSLKKKLKGTLASGDEEEAEELRAEIQSLKDKVTALETEHETAKTIESDKELSELQAMRKKNSELIASLRAKASITNSGAGSNQDKLKPKVDLSKSLSEEQRAIYQRVADSRGMSLETVLKYKAEADAEGKTVVQYMLDRKIK